MDGIKEEMEEAQLKVEMNRDSLAADIYSLLAKESDFAKVVTQFHSNSSEFRLVKFFKFDPCRTDHSALRRIAASIPFGRFESVGRAHSNVGGQVEGAHLEAGVRL